MSDLEPVGLETCEHAPAVPVHLWRRRHEGKPPVLLLHGASARHESFLVPVGPRGAARSLADWLFERGYEPWLLDWRGSGLVVDEVSRAGTLAPLKERFTFDAAARCDVPAALDKIRAETGAQRIAAVGHCMGAATLAQAVAAGHTEGRHLSHLVLLTLGLFYEPAWDGRIKSQDHVLERAWLAGASEVIDPRPRGAWPPELEAMYESWPDSLRPHRGDTAALSHIEHMCNRISFMYGSPYREELLSPEVHADLGRQFGAIPLRMYVHGAQNVRRGWAAGVDAPDDDTTLIDERARARFGDLESVTLITGARNQLWHRDSIDRMYEWLRRGAWRHQRITKHVAPGFAHQDLLWGTGARESIFPVIRAGLPPTP
jgi:hypothetical protein